MKQAMRLAVALLCLVAITMPTATAQQNNQMYTPAQGTPERAAILDALRARIERELKNQQIEFVIKEDAGGHLRVQNGWAFVSARPRRRDGKEIDYRRTIYNEDIKNGAFDDGIFALLRKRGDGAWRIAAYSFGATDVPWIDWDTQHRAPRAIFPYPDN